MARVYKGKYYANDFLEDSLESGLSFIWRSVLEARRVISARSNWKIGTRKETKIINHPGLNSMDNPYITTVSLVNKSKYAIVILYKHHGMGSRSY